MVYLKLSNQGDFTEDSVYITITSIKYKVTSRVIRTNARNKYSLISSLILLIFV